MSGRHRLSRPVARLIYASLRRLALAYQLGAREYHKSEFAAVGAGVSFDPTTSVFSYEHIKLGRDVFIGWGAYFYGDITIGDDVMFGPKVHLMGGYHRTDLVGHTIRNSGGAPWSPIVVENDVWVGARATILKGVRIGQGSVIGAESLVIDDMPPYVLAYGSPCRPVSKRFDDAELCRHLLHIGTSDDDAAAIVTARAVAFGELAGAS